MILSKSKYLSDEYSFREMFPEIQYVNYRWKNIKNILFPRNYSCDEFNNFIFNDKST